jgi:hypothetical protein
MSALQQGGQCRKLCYAATVGQLLLSGGRRTLVERAADHQIDLIVVILMTILLCLVDGDDGIIGCQRHTIHARIVIPAWPRLIRVDRPRNAARMCGWVVRRVRRKLCKLCTGRWWRWRWLTRPEHADRCHAVLLSLYDRELAVRAARTAAI